MKMGCRREMNKLHKIANIQRTPCDVNKLKRGDIVCVHNGRFTQTFRTVGKSRQKNHHEKAYWKIGR